MGVVCIWTVEVEIAFHDVFSVRPFFLQQHPSHRRYIDQAEVVKGKVLNNYSKIFAIADTASLHHQLTASHIHMVKGEAREAGKSKLKTLNNRN